MLYLGLYLRRLAAFPQQNQQNQQKILVARARYVTCHLHGTEMRLDVAQKQHGNHRFVVRTVNVNFFMTCTIAMQAMQRSLMITRLCTDCSQV